MSIFKTIKDVQMFDGFSIGVSGWVVAARITDGSFDYKIAQMVYKNKEDAEHTYRLLYNIMKELNND